jgi:glycosyltransferase involved in cell wall biosynthesis
VTSVTVPVGVRNPDAAPACLRCSLARYSRAPSSAPAAHILTPRICFVGLANLPVLAPEFEQHGIGGAELQQTLLAKALARRGFQVSMVVGDYGQQDGVVWSGVKTYKASKPREGVPVVRFVHPRWTKLVAALRRAAADVYYVSPAGVQVGQVALWARRNSRRMVLRLASDADCDPARLLISFWRDRKLYEYGLRRADAILAQSVNQLQLLRRNYGLDSSVVSSLVDIADSTLPLSERNISVLWVSNIQQLKRPELFLELARRLPTFPASMVGGAAPKTGDLFERVRIAASRVSNVTFHGPLPYQATQRLFDRARVFINTSEIEGFPNTFLQAWARGIPVVSFFDPDGVVQREGLGHAVASVEDMAAAVHRLVADPQVWGEASARCLAYTARRYGEDQTVAPYLEVLGRLMTAAPTALT